MNINILDDICARCWKWEQKEKYWPFWFINGMFSAITVIIALWDHFAIFLFSAKIRKKTVNNYLIDKQKIAATNERKRSSSA